MTDEDRAEINEVLMGVNADLRALQMQMAMLFAHLPAALTTIERLPSMGDILGAHSLADQFIERIEGSFKLVRETARGESMAPTTSEGASTRGAEQGGSQRALAELVGQVSAIELAVTALIAHHPRRKQVSRWYLEAMQSALDTTLERPLPPGARESLIATCKHISGGADAEVSERRRKRNPVDA